MDNPSQESSGALDTNQAASLFSTFFSEPDEREQPANVEAETEAQATEADAEPEAQAEAEADTEAGPEDDPTVTVKIDGKDVEVKLSELKSGYQRQADYTRKTMEVSEQRKAADAETQKARQERQAYAANLQRMQAQLEGVLQEQQKETNWEQLLQSDPVEYLRQQHLFQQRQAKYQEVMAEQQRVAAQFQAEQQEAHQRHLQEQHQALLDKLPEWKDAKKAEADRIAIREFLLNQGFDEQAVNQVNDARAVVLARKAMLYDQMMSKAQAAAKKVATLPTKVERPGNGVQGLDKRTSAYQKLSKSGKVEDAASVFASLL